MSNLRRVAAPPSEARDGEICTDGWAGRQWQRVLIVGETAKRYRVRAPEVGAVRLAGRNRWISGEMTALVPKGSVRIEAKGAVS